MSEVEVLNRSGRALPRGFRRIIPQLFADIHGEIVLSIVDDRQMKVLHRRWKGKNSTTDVLSFETGDIVINYDAAIRQAKDQGHSTRRELFHLAVHGMLHLEGWDDATMRERAKMDEETEKILDRAGVH